MSSLEAGQGSDADRMREQGRKAHSVRAVEHRCDWLLSVHKFVLLCFYWATVDGWMGLMKPGQAPGVFHKWDKVNHHPSWAANCTMK